ncbi:aminodeoxychorismate synthase component I [Massilia sp. TS11]|uniref:aminodeoxychorismate synthase component I n=1 Tax=Massilia sp. TS11 TaxID=2908003 RepID=UPI001EDC63D8|nr:aminodeoxychorismate synthase component I [Massilia sp. TS11]MCG2585252.1 aminodeoxychorismate synthase component I [Massilia sp. TS11]
MSLPSCFVLLDDAREDAVSRLFTGHVRTLRARDLGEWPALLEQLHQASQDGLYLVPLFSYELGQHLHGLPAKPLPGPLAEVLVFTRRDKLQHAEVDAWLAAHSSGSAGLSALHANLDADQFAAAIDRIRAYIAAGDTYQVNYTLRLRGEAYGSPLDLFRRLRARQPVPYGALVQHSDGSAVVSLSPELFVRHDDGLLTARPMKGTAAASGDPAIDAERARALAADPKNRAENLMIVDLLRNDLGRVAATGSVHAPALFEVNRFGGVLQMTSTVQARLRSGASLGDILDALYPCGSITGAPKRRTMEIIDELEPDARGLYTGAIGWIDPPFDAHLVGDFCLSVPIRTVLLQAPRHGLRQAELGVGAGIVYDSVAADEWQESLLKAQFLSGLRHEFELFETLYASSTDGVRHLERHLARLQASAAYFGIACDVEALRAAVRSHAAGLGEGAWRVRLSLQPDGSHQLSSAPLTPLAPRVRVLLADTPTMADDLWLRHKSSQRARYDAAWRAAEAAGAFDTLFFNERGELTEGGRSNVFVKLDGRWLTPPLSCGVLPGVMRSVLLADPRLGAREAIIRRHELRRAEDLLVCNAVRGAVQAEIASATE